MNLDYYGSGCRCLLRLWEDLGNPVMSDRTFISSHLPAFPEWEQKPGAASLERLIDLASELGVGSGGEIVSDYDRLLADYRAGHSILIREEHIPRDGNLDGRYIQYSVLVEMDESRFTRWEPARGGLADTVTENREHWDHSLSVGIVLKRAEVHQR
jgi:hypothetical protein